MSSPVSYSSAKASSDCAVLLYCDEGTAFSYLHTYYQSGVDPVYESTTVDTTDRTTPRELDELDFVEGNEHILVYDMNTGSVIDFYSTLNIYYAGGYEAQLNIEVIGIKRDCRKVKIVLEHSLGYFNIKGLAENDLFAEQLSEELMNIGTSIR